MELKNRNRKLFIEIKESIPVYLLSGYFVFVLAVYLIQEPVTIQRLLKFAGYLILWSTIALISLRKLSGARRFYREHSAGINAVLLLLSPIVSFLMVEIMVSNLNVKMFKSYSLYNVIWYIAIYYMIYVIIRNSKITITLGILLIYAVSALNYLVFLFRGNPVLPSDLLAWQTGMSVASGYAVRFTDDFVRATVIMLVMFVLGYQLEKPVKRPSVINRLAVIASYVVFFAVVYHAFFETNLIKSKIQVIDYFAPKYTYSDYGTAFGFVANIKAMETDYPEGYSVDKVRKALEGTVSNAGEQTQQEKPNIIVIMNEAFSDLSLLGDYDTNMDYLPYIRALSDHTIKGKLYVSVFGGATSDTEYEFLTGNSMAVLPQNSVPYQQFVTEPTDSLATTLKDQGYYNIAIHPYQPSGYKRDIVYPLLGFDEFLSMKDFPEPELIRSYISDRESYRKIIEQYENMRDKGPLFIFNVTMQNHGGYSSDQIFPEEDTVRLTAEPGHGTVEQYLSLLRKTDQAFETLIDYFSRQQEHTIILLFGDHQPVVYSEFYDQMMDLSKVNRLKYEVPFVLWANYDIGEKQVDKISANYLSSFLLETAGLKGTSYNAYLRKLYKKVPVINALYYIDSEDKLHGLTEANSYYDLINEYKDVGYNDALDKKGKLRHFFYLK